MNTCEGTICKLLLQYIIYSYLGRPRRRNNSTAAVYKKKVYYAEQKLVIFKGKANVAAGTNCSLRPRLDGGGGGGKLAVTMHMQKALFTSSEMARCDGQARRFAAITIPVRKTQTTCKPELRHSKRGRQDGKGGERSPYALTLPVFPRTSVGWFPKYVLVKANEAHRHFATDTPRTWYAVSLWLAVSSAQSQWDVACHAYLPVSTSLRWRLPWSFRKH
jgi:hypothetical protein